MSDDSTNPQHPQGDAVSPPPETPIPEGLLSDTPVIPPPPADILPADAVIPPPPAEAMLPSSRSARRKPSILEGEQPSAVADDWAKPSVAPEVPSSGGYRGFTVAIFAFLLILLAAAVSAGVFLATTMPFPFAAASVADVAARVAGGALPF